MIIFKTKILLLLIILSVIYLTSYCEKTTIEPENKVKKVEPIEPEMVLIDKDLTFTYGNSFFGMTIDSITVLTIEPYYIGKYELSNVEYYQFVLDNGYNNKEFWLEEGWEYKTKANWKAPLFWSDSNPPYIDDKYSCQDDTPVHGISYYEAEAYCNWLSKKTGKIYCIPTTAQWQRAAKGPNGYKYPWGNTWTENRTNYFEILSLILIPVNSLPHGRSYEGCYNMMGNANEISIPIPADMLKDNWIVIYSVYNGSSMDISDILLLTTNISGNPIYKSGKYRGNGIRVCKIRQ